MSVPAGTVYGPDLSNHNSAVDFAGLDALSDVHLVTHKITEGVGWTDPTVAGRAPSLQRFAAAGFYHVLWPTNSQDNPTNQAAWFVDEVIRLAPWMLHHPCPVLQGDFELFSNFVPYRAPTIAECNAWGDEVLRLWTARGGNKPAQVDYAPYWLYGGAVTGLKHLWWASSYVSGSGQYRPLYPGNGDSRWTQVPGKPADILQYSSSASFGSGTTSVDANGVRGVSTAAELQRFLLGGDPEMPLTPDDLNAIAGKVRDVLNEGAGKGTNGTWSQTNQNMYNRTGDLINTTGASLAQDKANGAALTDLSTKVAHLQQTVDALPGGATEMQPVLDAVAEVNTAVAKVQTTLASLTLKAQ